MLSSRMFQAALIISVIVHGALLIQKPFWHLPSAEQEKKLKVSYVEEKAHPKPLELHKPSEPLKKEPLFNLDARIAMDKKLPPPPFVEKRDILKEIKPSVAKLPDFIKPSFVGPDVIAVKKKVSLPRIDPDKFDNPAYISYYQIVREKIRRAAYQNYTYSRNGEVYLSFIVASSGALKAIRLVPEKSSADASLQDIALRSIQQASPFPAFPKELDYPQLSFNIIISFEIE